MRSPRATSLHAQQPQLSQPLHTGEVFQSLQRLGGLSCSSSSLRLSCTGRLAPDTVLWRGLAQLPQPEAGWADNQPACVGQLASLCLQRTCSGADHGGVQE